MKRNDFLQNLLLIILSAILTASIVNLACVGALPVTYISHARVQIIGEALHVSDVKEFAGYIESDESLRNKAMELCGADSAAGSAGAEYRVEATAMPDNGIVDLYVTSGDPYTSHDIAEAIVMASYSDYPASHSGILVKLIEAASVADTPVPRPVFTYTIIGAVLGAILGALLTFLAVKGEREKRRRSRTSDPRFARIEEQDEQVYDALFAEDNEDVDPEMRELYKVTKRAKVNREQPAPEEETAGEEEAMPEENDSEQPASNEEAFQESHMSEEAEAAYLEAMEIEATATDDEVRMDTKPVPDEETEGGDPYEE